MLRAEIFEKFNKIFKNCRRRKCKIYEHTVSFGILNCNAKIR